MIAARPMPPPAVPSLDGVTLAALAALLLALLREPLARLYVQQAAVAGLAASLVAPSWAQEIVLGLSHANTGRYSGVAVGTEIPNHVDARNPGNPDSAIVGMWGKNCERSIPVVAMGWSLPAFI